MSAETLLRVLLGAKAETAAWWDLALCAEVDPDLHFPEKGDASGDAKRVCRACPVRAQCLSYALEHNIHWGIWGMTSPRERADMRRRQGRAA